MTPLWIMLLVLALGGTIAYAAYLQEKKRTQELGETAIRIGWQFDPLGEAFPSPGLPAFKLFSAGHGRKRQNLLYRSAGNEVCCVFDYRYTVGSGKQQHTHRQTVALFYGGPNTLPPFAMGPENFLHKLGDALGFDDIDFASHPGFSKSYRLRSPDEPATRSFFTPPLLGFFEQHPGWTLESLNGAVIIYRSGNLVRVPELNKFIAETEAAFRNLVRR